MAKHMEVDRHFIKEKLENGLLCTPYMPISSEFADVLIKDLSNPTFRIIIGKLEMDNLYFPT